MIMSSEAGINRRGLLKLMLRMPALRERLQTLTSRDENLFALCGAFEDATSTLDELRRQPSERNKAVISEYEELCQDIEREISEICSR